ncbi:hypothetical protein CEE36_11425 [candidate division TA06 bacterium B3_TA06]|uniref:Phosphatidylglycerol lysyltransferase C-terminal domain-containing protein n=1 Tax=candidate division TA06 bacterium B3_TA06 TaxID=2012487 RepID=A0A532UNW3_UNCT6|nr:MAG: hypothetical protein CEE36_11425 [candidate division TA06 bacterium B3_TA06]
MNQENYGGIMHPEFPSFKPIDLEDRDFIHEILWRYQPEISKLCFANLYNWRHHYSVQWCMYEGTLLLLAKSAEGEFYAFPPVAQQSRADAVRMLLTWLRDECKSTNPRIERADRRLVEELEGSPDFSIEPQREHHDYIYLREDLVNLSGRKFHSKKNHLNAFMKNYQFTYAQLDESHVARCLELAEAWCMMRRCSDDMSLISEREAVNEALANFSALKLMGGVILIEGKTQAFSVGELLNKDTAVVHIEKANPGIRGLYAAINQQCAEHAWGDVAYINREQDLGEEGIRKAKLSYHPHHLVENFIISLA